MCSKYISTLTIAGSDSSGGAGIQADIKTMSALGCYACSVITAITAQDTTGVHDILYTPPQLVASQLRAVLDDIHPAAIKTGMIGTTDNITAVSKILADYSYIPLVVDTVAAATSGDALMEEGAQRALVRQLIPLATLITPNLPEATMLTGCAIHSPADLRQAARRFLAWGCQAVLIKGGHQPGATKSDWLFTAEGTEEVFSSPVVETANTHGTGCTLSAAITAFLAQGDGLPEAIGKAKKYLYHALEAGKNVVTGRGHGPVNHFFHPENLSYNHDTTPIYHPCHATLQ